MAQGDYNTGTGAMERVMPQNIDAERAVLAAMILDDDKKNDVLTKIKDSKVFYRPAHQKIFEAIVDLYDDQVPVDQLSLAERLKTRGQLEEVGGKPYIIELVENSYALVNYDMHVDIIKRCHTLRGLIAASTRITALAYDAPDNIDQVVEEAEKQIFEVTDKQVSRSFQGISKLLRDSVKTLDEQANNKSHLIGVPTGFKDLDKQLAGLRDGSLTIIAARPGVGKTSFALNIGINAAKAGKSVAFFSLEMAAAEIMPRIFASEANIKLERMRNATLASSDWEAITRTADVLNGLSFAIDDSPGLSITEMRAKARRQMHGKESNGLIIVDYLQLMQPKNSHTESRQVEVAEISRGLKVLAKEMNMPVIALSQLSRAIEARKGKVPVLSDLRESGSIEQDADIVMFIDRSMTDEEALEKDRPDPGMANIHIAKNRNGAIAVVPVAFNGASTKFSDLARVSV